MATEKKFNKILIGAILGTTLLGVAGAAMTPQGKKVRKSLFGKVRDFISGGIKEMKKTTKKVVKKGEDENS